MTEIDNPDVARAFADTPDDARAGLMRLRALILDTAADLPSAQPLREELRWGQPAYLAPKGSTLRLGVPKSGGFALFVHCRSRLIPEFTQIFPEQDRIEGTRAVLFDDPSQIDAARHGWLVARALTYHHRPSG